MARILMKLAIISHTPHYSDNGVYKAWGPTVREINHLPELFEEIYHVAPLHSENAPESSLCYSDKKIKFIPIKPYGGEKLTDKISILTTSISNLQKISEVIKKADWVQFRAPTAMGLYVLPYLSLKSKPDRWVKYAGNWQMKDPPLSYRIQKWWLENNFQRSYVTINGHWEGQKEHLLNFQNPCLDDEELIRAKDIAVKKKFEDKLTLGFAGSLTKNKGVDIILDALNKIKDKSGIKEMIFAGDSNERKNYEKAASLTDLKFRFEGSLSREDMEKFYEEVDLILLPSESEGFPKVIAEAAAYGCVPIVSDVSSIGQYFNDSNGFLLKDITSDELADKITSALKFRAKLKNMSLECLKVAELFTFRKYMNDLKTKILDKGKVNK
ncbi:MAG TPA: glycosyltransferase family 4 protein [Ignavibacteria bacterium]|nr:glycosyltransferase family 4 protein [Ignavibacteria bacterium]